MTRFATKATTASDAELQDTQIKLMGEALHRHRLQGRLAEIRALLRQLADIFEDEDCCRLVDRGRHEGWPVNVVPTEALHDLARQDLPPGLAAAVDLELWRRLSKRRPAS